MAHPASDENLKDIQKKYAPNIRINKENTKLLKQNIILLMTLTRDGQYTSEDLKLFNLNNTLVDLNNFGKLVEKIDMTDEDKQKFYDSISNLINNIFMIIQNIAKQLKIRYISDLIVLTALTIEPEIYKLFSPFLPNPLLMKSVENKLDIKYIISTIRSFLGHDVEDDIEPFIVNYINIINNFFKDYPEKRVWLGESRKGIENIDERFIIVLIESISNNINLNLRIDLIMVLKAIMNDEKVMLLLK